MQSRTGLCWLIFCLVLSFLSHSQTRFYQRDTTVKVYAYGQERTLAWSGGFNNPQFSMGDLNNDGLADIVVFTPWIGVQTFINKGTAGNPNYRYAPEYELNFPPIFDYLILADYNCDGIPDLFDQGTTGFEVYRGYYNGLHQLCFTFYTNLYYGNDLYAGGWANAFNNPGDIPAIVDVDGDGDLDFVAYDISGGWMNLYKNLRAELGLPCDSIRIGLKDRCWGRVYQGFFRTHSLQRTCDESHLLTMPGHDGGKRAHSGNTPCLFDWDMDGDYDYLDGSVSFNEMTFLKNGRIEAGGSAPDSMVWQDSLWQTGGKQIEIPFFPAAFNVDVDQDGKKDLLIAPNGVGVNFGTENYKCIWYYKNFSTPGSPDWRFQSDSFFTDKTIDLGTAAYPMFFDYNKDGKPDMFIGSDGYYNNGLPLLSKLSYYQNTGTATHPAFTLQTSDFMGISADNFSGAAPAFGDIDGDGKADMILGHADGTLSYFKNIAASDSVTPNWQLMEVELTDMNGDTINVDGHAAPFIYDMDTDGKKDLIIGDIYGHIRYYQNVTTTPGNISLKLINSQLGGVSVDSPRTYDCNAAPFIGKIDSTGIEYLLVGSGSGNVYKYTGFQSGDTAARYTLLDAHYAYIDSTYLTLNHPGTLYGIYDNRRSTVAVGDIAGDGNYYMVVGDVRGGVGLYKNKVYTPDHSGISGINENGRVAVYPNPSKDILNISWNGMAASEVHISFVNMAGQTLFSTVFANNTDHTSLPVSMLPDGTYVCLLQSGVNRYYSKFVIIR